MVFSLISAILSNTPVILNDSKTAMNPTLVHAASTDSSQSPPTDESSTQNAASFAKSLNQDIMNLYAKYLSEDGTHVDYDSLSKSPEFEEFSQKSIQLRYCLLKNLSQDERKALFLNLYNIIVIHAYCKNGIPHSLGDRLKFYKNTGYMIENEFYSLDDIEHGVLRGNTKHPAPYVLSAQFSKKDPRGKYVCERDPRIHFALVCGAKSCPPIRIYSPSNLNFGLNAAAKNFLKNGGLKIEGDQIHLSMIMKWYHDDFGTTDAEMLQYLAQFLDEERSELEGLLKSGKYKVQYMKYNWDVNGSDVKK